MSFASRFRRGVLSLAATLTLALFFSSCPPATEPPPETDGKFRVLVTTGVPDAAKETLLKGLSAVSPEEILALEVTVEQITLLGEAGVADLPVLTAPVQVDLVDLSGISSLLADFTAEDGTYDGVEVAVSDVLLTLSSDPLNPIALALPVSGRFVIDFAFEVLPDSGGILVVDFGGLGVYYDGGGYVFEPSPGAALRSQVQDSRISGRISALDRGASTFTLLGADASYTVAFAGTPIYKVGDFTEATGTAADLENQMEVAVRGTLSAAAAINPSQIEIVDLPDTSDDERGDRITICHFHLGDATMAYSISVSRSRLQFYLDRGDFIGPCEDGETFTLVYQAGAGGTLEGETTQSVAPGSHGGPVTAVAEDGFAFDQWSDGRRDNPRTDRAVGGDLTVTALFVEVFSLTYTAGEGGTIAGPARQSVVGGANGAQVTAVRDPGFVFAEWSDGRTDNPRIDENITADLSVSANFLPIYTLSYAPGDGGFLEGPTSQMIISGSSGTAVTAVPAPDYVFVQWSDGRLDNPRTDSDVGEDVSVTAVFALEYTLRYLAGPNGRLQGDTTQVVPGGLSGTAVTAVGDSGFGFVRWSDGRTDNPRIDSDISGDVSVTAEFATAITLTYLAGSNGGIEGNGEQVIGIGGDGSPVTAVPDGGFGFDRWSDGSTANPRTDTGVTADLTVTASFMEAFTFTYTAGPNGSLSGVTEQLVIAGRNGTPVAAVPDEGYAFDQWSDGSLVNPRTELNANEDLSVTAEFLPVYTLSYAAGGNGTIEGAAEQSVIEGGSGTAVTALANTGYAFLEWSDGVADNPRTDRDVAEDIAVTATFVAGASLNYSPGEHGTLTGEVNQLIEIGGSGTPVTAVPDEGYIFLDWSDGRSDNPRVDTGVQESLLVTANYFAEVEMLTVPGGQFIMGRSDVGDDLTGGDNDELPRHAVTLSEYEIGKFEVTNEQYSAFLNYLNSPARNLLRRENGGDWEAHNEAIFYDGGGEEGLSAIFRYNFLERSLAYNRDTGLLEPLLKQGLPEGTTYSMYDHPATESTWFGAVLFANWLSERSGLEPVYDTTTWEGDFTKTGYRLPTEAEWERAAAWEGERHWIYGFTSDTLEGNNRVNYYNGTTFLPPPDFDNPRFVNPLGLVQDSKTAYTSPVGWFNGVNVSPNGNIQTVDSKSPIGAYDMSGNVVEWCHDWYSATYYENSPVLNPTGPETGNLRVVRGGCWARQLGRLRNRTAYRFQFSPDDADGIVGFRLARTTGNITRFTLAYSAGENGSIAGENPQSVVSGEDGMPVTAVPADGYGFVQWSDGVTDNPRADLMVLRDLDVSAEFAALITLTYLAGGNGTIDGPSEQVIGGGATGQMVTAVPDSGYGFEQWSDGSTDNPRIDGGLTEDFTVTAQFVPAYTVTYSAGENGTISGETVQVVNTGRDTQPVTAEPDDTYGFLRWSDSRRDNPRTDFGVTQDISVEAEFVRVYNVRYTAGPNGSLEGPLDQLVLEGDSGFAVTAVPAEGFSFIDWSDGVTDNPREDSDVSADIDVTANFAAVFRLTYNTGENGTVTGDTDQLIDAGTSGTAVEAVPDSGYLFLQWSDGSIENPRVDEDVMAQVVVTAEFFKTIEMLPVPGGTFPMGNTSRGDDAQFGQADEFPQHDVTLSAYEIGKYEITNYEYAVFLNYMCHPTRNLLKVTSGNVWSGQNDDIWYRESESPQPVFLYRLGERNLNWESATGTFIPRFRIGLPDNTPYNQGNSPVTEPTWYGAVLYCNWLSERAGLEPVYDLDTWEPDFSKNGYHLPTEAQWERAAAWDGMTHWIYGFSSDELSGRARATFHDGTFLPHPDLNNERFVNPLGLIQDDGTPYYSPVGWFNGINISPNGNVQTIDSKSPVGAYDMSGNVVEWVHDWHSPNYYSESAEVDPEGPETGTERVMRGGTWGRLVAKQRQRTAVRFKAAPTYTDGIVGFRIAR